MIERAPIQILAHSTDAEFWCAEYRERPIAILYRHGRMHVYLDHVLQHNVVFESGADALACWFNALIRASPHGSIDLRADMFVVN